MSIQPAQVLEAVRTLFAHGNDYDVSPLTVLDDDVDVIAEDLLYEISMLAGNDDQVAVRLFLDIGDLGTALWAYEVRAMLRFSSSLHPALPRIRDGGVRHIPFPGRGSTRVAFVVSDRAGDNLGDPRNRALLQQRRVTTVKQFALLVDGLRILHAAGLSHRNLYPAAVEVLRRSPVDHDFRLRLSRFEMSALEANLLRRGPLPRDCASAFLTQSGNRSPQDLVFTAPERLELLFPKGAIRIPPELRSGDIFSLGLLAFTWFVGDLEADAVRGVFPDDGLGSHAFDRSSHAELLRSLRSRIALDRSLPPTLGDLIVSMLREGPTTRPTAYEVVDTLARHYEGLSTWYGEQPEARSYLVAIMPEEFRPTAFRWGWISDDPATPEGLGALRSFIESDLRGGTLEHCEGGWASVYGTDAPDHKRTDLVLHGQRGAYFGHFFEYRLPHEEDTQGVTLPEVFLIRQVIQLDGPFARRYHRPVFRRTLPSIEVLPWTSPRVAPARARRHASWESLSAAVRVQVAKPETHQDFEDALRFFLELQRVELDAHQYAFKRVDVAAGDEVSITFDLDRDESRRLTRPMLHLFCSNQDRRPPFGDFFSSLEDRGLGQLVVYRPNEGRQKDDVFGTARVIGQEGPNGLRLKIVSGSPVVPIGGWLEPADDWLARVVLDRQWVAFRELLEHPALLGQLVHPHALFEPSPAWKSAADEFVVTRGSRAGGRGDQRTSRTFSRLRGRRSRKALHELLGSSPFYALQGPPGTGKTTIAARAVRAALLSDPSLRILVSAQSHFALDNFAATVLDYLPEEPEVLPLRVASENREVAVDHAVAPFLPKNVADRLTKSIRERCRRRLSQRSDSEELRALLNGWREQFDELMPEVLDRVRRGSNLVFSTCGFATEAEVGVTAGLGSYDWVIIEEAAKAWPTELAIALVRGQRWALIGDQRQLSAYRLREVLQFLDECEQGPESLKAHARRKRAYAKALKLFESFFTTSRSVSQPPRAEKESDEEAAEPQLIRPVRTLNMQFRMARPIAEVVNCFYDEPLKPGPDVDRPHGIEAFGENSVVWLDTGEEIAHRCEPCWFNAGEVDTVNQLMGLVQPLANLVTEKDRERRLAILSPYRDQVNRLSLGLGSLYQDRVHTIDSFQGREAEVVCVSLVRRRGGHVGATATSRFGHLVNEQRVNVMLSRARRLLLIIGDIYHFETLSEGPGLSAAFWPRVCETVRRCGHVEKTAHLFARLKHGTTRS